MALAVNQVSGASENSGTPTTPSLTTVSGSLIVVIGTEYNSSATPVGSMFTDSKSNTYTLVGADFGSTGFQGVVMAYNDGGTRGSSHTVTFTPGGGSTECNIHVIEITGHAASAALDTTTDTFTVDLSHPWAVTAAAAISGNQIAIAGASGGDGGNGTWTNPSGYTDIFEVTTTTSRCLGGAWYKINETGTPTVSMSFSTGTSSGWVGFATFKEATSSDPTPAAVAAVAAVPTPTITSTNPYKVADRGIRTNTGTGDATVTLTNPTLITTGNYLIARIAVDNSGTNGARPGLTLSDARNGTWTVGTGALQDPGSASAGMTCYLGYVKVTTGYQAADAVTFDWTTGTPRSAIVIEEWANINGTTPLAVAEVQANNVSSTAQPTAAITPLAAAQLVYVVAAIEGFSSYWGSQDADTTDGSWSDVTKDEANTGTAATSASVYGGYKVVSGTTAQTWNNTLGTTSDWATAVVVFAAATTATNINAAAVAAVAAVPTPTISRTTTPTPTAVAAITAIPTPAITTGVSLAVTAVAAVVAIPTPTRTATANPAPTAVAATTAIATPTRTATANPAVTAVAAVVAVPTPPVTTGVSIAVTAVAAVTSIATPTRTATANPAVTVVAAVVAVATPTVAGFDGLYPASISGRKLLDQHGDVYLARPFSSWGMFKLTDAQVTTALEGLAARHFNGATVWIGGGAHFNSTWSPYYENDDGDDYWTGTPWQSSFGPAWSTIDWIVAECARLGLVAHLSLGPSWGTTGPAPEILAASTAQMRQVGIDVATRYLAYPNIVWHVMFDDSPGPGSSLGLRVEAYFDGINDTEGASARPVRWCEVANGSSTNEQGWYQTTDAKFSINCLYEYVDNSTEAVETVYAELTAPIGDCEPVYDGAPHYSGNLGQQLRERSYAVFLEGGCLINYGSEAWWAFGPPDRYGLVADSETLDDWTLVPDHDHTVQQQYVWDLIDVYVADLTWAPTSSFVTTGAGSGDTKAAVGAADSSALAYFPSFRTVVVDTTIIVGTSNVRLRWYDPTAGTFSSIAASEAQQSGRSVSYPSAHGDSTNDWVLVVDVTGDASPAVTVVAAVVAVATPTLTTTSNAAVTAVAAVAAIPTPSISTGADANIAVTAVAAVAAIPTPVIGADIDITATAVTAIAAVPTPTPSSGTSIAVTTVAGVAAIATPGIVRTANISVTAVAAVAAIPTPTRTATATVAVTTVAATAIVGASAPFVSAFGGSATQAIVLQQTATAVITSQSATQEITPV